MWQEARNHESVQSFEQQYRPKEEKVDPIENDEEDACMCPSHPTPLPVEVEKDSQRDEENMTTEQKLAAVIASNKIEFNEAISIAKKWQKKYEQSVLGEVEKDGAALIAEERKRQVEIEGWTPIHDDKHDTGSLAAASSAYTLLACEQIYPEVFRSFEDQAKYQLDTSWPWNPEFWKPSPDPIRNLVKAGALIAAEIDRLQRLAATTDGGEG